MMLSLDIHAQSVRLVHFWPGNGNSIRLEFTPRPWSDDKAPQQIQIYLDDAARAWEVYDTLKDAKTELRDVEDEAALRDKAFAERDAALAKEAARAADFDEAGDPAELEHEDEGMPF